MVMAAQIRVKAGSLPGRPQRGDETQFFEPPEGPVEYCRHSFTDALVDLFRVGVVVGLRHFTENFHALMG